MSTTIHVGKSKTFTVAQVNGQPVPDGFTFGWMCSQDGGNITLDGRQNTCTVKCVGVKQQGDYVPGQPVLMVALITAHDGTETRLTTNINLVEADVPETPEPLAGSELQIIGTWSAEE